MSFLLDVPLTIDELPVGDVSRRLIRLLAHDVVPAAVIVVGADGPEVDTVVGAFYSARFCESHSEICRSCERCTNVQVEVVDRYFDAYVGALRWAATGTKCLRVNATRMGQLDWVRLRDAVAARETPPLVVCCTQQRPANSPEWPIVDLTPASHKQLTRAVGALAAAMNVAPPPLPRSRIDFAGVGGTILQEQLATKHPVAASGMTSSPQPARTPRPASRWKPAQFSGPAQYLGPAQFLGPALQSEPEQMTLFGRSTAREEVSPGKSSGPRRSTTDRFRMDLTACTGLEFLLDGVIDLVLYGPRLQVDWADLAFRTPTETELRAPRQAITALHRRGLLGPPPYSFLDVMRVNLFEVLKKMGCRSRRQRDGAMKLHLTKPYGHVSVSKRASCLVLSRDDPRSMGMGQLVRLPSIKMSMLSQRQE